MKVTQLYRDGVAVPGATDASYVLTAADIAARRLQWRLEATYAGRRIARLLSFPKRFAIPKSQISPSPALGLAFPFETSTYQDLADNGFGLVRIAASWNLIQPDASTWNWTGLDGRVAAIRAAGMQPFLTFASDAAWATSPGDNTSLNKMPDDLADWTAFVAAVAARYDGDVIYYQFANEFAGIDNGSGGWASTKENLVACVNAGYAAVKANATGTTVFMGGVASTNLDLVLVNNETLDGDVVQALSESTEIRITEAEARSAAYDTLIADRYTYPLQNADFDGVSAHLYGDRSRDEARIDAVLATSSASLIISTESGAPTWTGTEPTDKAYFVEAAMSTLGALAAGCDVVFWFLDYPTGSTFYNQHVPLRDEDGQPKPNLWGMKMIAGYLTPGATVTKLAEGVFFVDGAVDAVFGLWSDVSATSQFQALSDPTIWVLEDPANGILAQVTPSADDFVVVEV